VQVTITTRHTEIGGEIHDFAARRVGQLAQYWSRLTEGHLIIDTEGRDFLVELNLRAGRHPISCHAHNADLHAAIEGVIKKTEKRLKKMKGKLEDHRKGYQVEPGEASAVPEDLPRLIKDDDIIVKTMSEREATMTMRSSDLAFLVFRSEGSGRPSVVYRRSDGNLGLIELD